MRMWNRWAALPQGIRWLVGIASVVLAAAIVWALFVPVADWLAHHDVGSVTGSLHETALDNARGRLLTLGAGLFAAGALIFTARNFTVSRRTLELTEQGQVTDRYTKAIEQLGSDKLDVRIGGIYALERVARDSARDHPTVIEVLAAFIREHSRDQSDHPANPEEKPSVRPDVQAALTVVGRREIKHDIRFGRIDLTRAALGGAALAYAALAYADLIGADLTGADLSGADLSRANLSRANLGGAVLDRAHLTFASLPRANLTGASLQEADLAYANLTAADLTDAYVGGAVLTDVTLTNAKWPGNATVPTGWRLDASSSLLLPETRQWHRPRAATPDSGPADAERPTGGAAQNDG
jgi:hypothetical protein